MKKQKWEILLNDFNETMMDAGAEVVDIRGARSKSFYGTNAVKGIEYAMTITNKIMEKYVNPIEDGETTSIKFRANGSSIVLTFKKLSEEEIMMRKSLKEFGII